MRSSGRLVLAVLLVVAAVGCRSKPMRVCMHGDMDMTGAMNMTGDLGMSIRMRQPAIDAFFSRLPNTLIVKKKAATVTAPSDSKFYGTPDPTLLIERLSEEHATVKTLAPTRLKVGDRVSVLPNHSCVVTNLMDELVLAEDGQVTGRIRVDARGKIS